jgi:hypothetical protein
VALCNTEEEEKYLFKKIKKSNEIHAKGEE